MCPKTLFQLGPYGASLRDAFCCGLVEVDELRSEHEPPGQDYHRVFRVDNV